MIWRIAQLWIIIGICIFEPSVSVNSLEHGKIKSRNNKEHKFHSFYDKTGPGIDIDFDVIIDTLLESVDSGTANLKRLGRKVENETERTVKGGIKNAINKIYNVNKKHSLRPVKADEPKSHNRDNLLIRLFSDSYKPCTQKSIVKKKREDGFLKKLDIFSNNNSYPSIAESIIPISHFGRENRKMNNDKICKAEIINIFPKKMKKNFENKFETGTESHKPSIFGDDEWEVRQDILEEEILPFREKSNFNIQDVFRDETKNLFDDIQIDVQNIMKMLPFSFFDTVFIKLSTTEKPKIHIKIKEGNLNNNFHSFFENLRNKRQATSLDSVSNTSSLLSTIKENYVSHNDNKTVFEMLNTTEGEKINITKDSTGNKTVVPLSGVKKSSAVLKKDTPNSAAINTIFVDRQNITRDAVIENDYVITDEYSPLNVTNSTDTNTTSTVIEQNIINTREIKDKKSNFVDLLEMQESEVNHYDENTALETAESIVETTKSPKESDSSGFLIILGVIPGIVGLIIVVSVLVIWLVQRKSWMTHNSPRNEGSSMSQPKSASC